ncbi:MAG: Endoglucanase A precursor [Bacteroidetes bacterium ADurb.Bin217]|mgnify:CR=1 FL=1|nr:MAG: Endoglucanase A precursor [Bacteroidetes bacterium ADurb.Bin217]HOS84367.1 glycosyl hydrolase family 8 [Bacteroidales bacterium]
MIRLIVFTCFLLAFGRAYAQQYPFPQQQTYAYGVMSSHITAADISKDYIFWKQHAVAFCNETEARIMKFPNDSKTTVSEGIAYGMLISAYMGDKQLFDKLVNYYKSRCNSNGMMNWIYIDCESGDNKKNGATDADIDIACALLVAAKQWPGEPRYKQLASAVIDSLQVHNFVVCNGEIIQRPGDEFGGCNCTNPSYYSPAYYKLFATIKKAEGNMAAYSFWEKAYFDVYSTLLKNAHPITGLVYAWTNFEGKDPSDCYYEVSGSGTYNSYQYDACRTPWRITMDYVWFGNEQAHDYLQRISRFVQAPVYAQYDEKGRVWYGAGGIANVVDSYWTNGLRRINPDYPDWGHRHAIAFVGSFALASMATNQQYVDHCMKEFGVLTATRYYESCLGLLYKLLATGNFWYPGE